MEDVGRAPTDASPVLNLEPTTIPTLDGWIESLMTCKQLAESDVQRLCEKVSWRDEGRGSPRYSLSDDIGPWKMRWIAADDSLATLLEQETWALRVIDGRLDADVEYRREKSFRKSQMCSPWYVDDAHDEPGARTDPALSEMPRYRLW